MRTEIQALIDNIDVSIKTVKNLAGYSHTSDDVAIHVRTAGAALERFFKDAVYNNPSTRDNFVDLINRLSTFGITQATLDAFHDLRLLYNSTKHNAAFTTTVNETSEISERVVDGLKELQTKNVSNVSRPYRILHNRTLWLSAWDHYISGETEISIFLPQMDTVFPPVIEHFNIKCTGWDVIQAKYTSSNELLLGKLYLPEEVYNFWKHEGDFIDAGIFKGDLKELVSDLSKHIDFNIENQLLPGLKREDDFSSVKCAVAFSLLDSFNDNSWDDISDLKDEIFLRAAYDYGINISSKYLKFIVEDISPTLASHDKVELSQIDEILWTNKLKFSKQKIKLKLFSKFDIGVNDDNKIVTNLE